MREDDMTRIAKRRRAGVRLAALISGAALLASACGAKPEDYAWAPAAPEVASGQDARVAVRLEGPKGLVTLAPETVASARLTMGHEGQAPMVAPLRPVPAGEGESLAWETDLTMSGDWALELTASVPGLSEPLVGEVMFTAVEGR
jgi:hypothetical protein